MNIFSSTFTTLEQALNYSSTKQKIISENIANADTPNYKAKDVNLSKSFGSDLESSIQAYRTDQRHFTYKPLSSELTKVFAQNNVQYNNNGNSVDVDKEMSNLASNQIYYNALIERTSGKFSSLLNVIKGGR
ncbi:flagellar basal body rod protein FlgB [Peribacillus loiseleuriae]|uniref:flagellar basal body rod protein FlgB n=1 Tax=Peribacillus loiseleuriae TaxID=1679170 RepID=UPI0037F89F30